MSYFPKHRVRGFSLVELMVSVVIGLIALSFATRMMVSAERTKQTTVGASDSMQNGMQALFSINRDAAQAGWGLNDPLIGGCDTIFNIDGSTYALPTAPRGAATIRPMSAVLITSNGNAPDELSLYAGSSPSGTGSVGLGANYTGGTVIGVDRLAFNFRSGDAILVVPDRSDVRCSIAELSEGPRLVSGVQQLIINTSGTRLNRSTGLGQNYTSGVTRIFNLGRSADLAFHTWSIQGGFLRLRATNLAGALNSALPVIDNIVTLKAQYGFDNRSAASFVPEAGLQIGSWSPIMIDADGDGVVGGPGDYARIAAIRLGVVARGKQAERPDAATGKCKATDEADAPQLFTQNLPQGVATVTVTPTITVAGDSLHWTCYRYRVFETIVPMRNLAWRPTSL